MNRKERRAVAARNGRTKAERKEIALALKLQEEAARTATPALDAAGFEVQTPTIVDPFAPEG